MERGQRKRRRKTTEQEERGKYLRGALPKEDTKTQQVDKDMRREWIKADAEERGDRKGLIESTAETDERRKK